MLGVKGESLLKPNGIIIVDNTLWKGLVLNEVVDHLPQDLKESCPNPSDFGDARRMTAIAQHMHRLNVYLSHSNALLEPVLLPLRDGLTIVRYKGQ